jgi:hypothetical protein
MFTNMTQTAVQIPSTVGMPACGHAFVTISDSARLRAFGTSVVRDGQATGTKGLVGNATIPGTTAWRPPTS